MYIICLFLRDEEAKLYIQIYLYKVILEGQKHKKARPRVSLRFWDLRQQSSKDRDSISPPTLGLRLWEEVKSVEAVVFPACVSVHTCLVPKEKKASDPLQPSLSQMV